MKSNSEIYQRPFTVLRVAASGASLICALAFATPPARGATNPSNNVPGALIADKTNDLSLNYHDAPLDLVLNDLCNSAGFIAEIKTPVEGKISAIGKHLSADETVALLDSELGRLGYAAVRNGRVLQIMSRREAMMANNTVRVLADPKAVPDTDEIATYIIPIRYIEARELVSELSVFMPDGARVIANEAGNSIVITDSQSRIKHVMEIIKAVDSGAADETVMQMFHLDFADAQETASLISNLFGSQGAGPAQLPMQFGGPGFNFVAAATPTTDSGNAGRRRNQQVVAAADPRTASVAVVASRDQMPQIVDLIKSLDKPASKDLRVAVIPVNYADATVIVPVLQQMFQTSAGSTSVGSSSSQQSMLQNRINKFMQNSSSSSSVQNPFGTGGGSGRGATP